MKHVLKELSEQENQAKFNQLLYTKHPIDIEEIEEVLYYAKKILELK